jgi:hypothetical protein
LSILLLTGIQSGVDSIFEVHRFDPVPARLVIHRDLFNIPADENDENTRLSESRQSVSTGRNGVEAPGDVPDGDPEALMSRRISYEGYTRKGGRYYFLVRVDGEFFIGNPGIIIAGNIRIIDGNDEMIHCEIEGERVEIKIRDLVQ